MENKEEESPVDGYPLLEECLAYAKKGLSKDSLENGELDGYGEHLVGSTWAFIEGRIENRLRAQGQAIRKGVWVDREDLEQFRITGFAKPLQLQKFLDKYMSSKISQPEGVG